MSEPRLDIKVVGQSVRLRVHQPIAPARLFHGKRPADVLRLAPLLFNLCPAAHHAAASSTLGIEPNPSANLALATEILREHALVMLRDWPNAFGMAASHRAMAGLAMLSAGRLAALEADLFGMSADAFLAQPDAVAPETPPLRLLRIVAEWPPEWAAAPVKDDPTFIARCLDHGEHLTLHRRMLLRLRESARLILEIRSGAPSIRWGRLPDGTGWAEAARGRLTHRATLAGDIITDHRIETPTEAMIAPGSFLERLLNSALSTPPTLRATVFALALANASPCLAVTTHQEAA